MDMSISNISFTAIGRSAKYCVKVTDCLFDKGWPESVSLPGLRAHHWPVYPRGNLIIYSYQISSIFHVRGRWSTRGRMAKIHTFMASVPKQLKEKGI